MMIDTGLLINEEADKHKSAFSTLSLDYYRALKEPEIETMLSASASRKRTQVKRVRTRQSRRHPRKSPLVCSSLILLLILTCTICCVGWQSKEETSEHGDNIRPSYYNDKRLIITHDRNQNNEMISESFNDSEPNSQKHAKRKQIKLRSKRWLVQATNPNVGEAVKLDNITEADSNANYVINADGRRRLRESDQDRADRRADETRGRKSKWSANKLRRDKRRNDRKPILNDFSFPTNLVQGMRFVLMCQVLDGDSPIQIKWFKDNREIQPASSSTSGSPHTNVGVGESNQGEQTAIGSSSLELASNMLDPNGNANANQNGNANLNPSSGIELIANEELGASLLFRHVQAKHAGNYTCLASNPFGSSAYSSQMSVKVPPTWKIEPQERESIMGEHIIIDCQAFGNPNPFIRWKFASLNANLASSEQSGPMASNLPLDSVDKQASNQLRAPASNQLEFNQNLNQHQQHQQFKLINSNHHVQTLENGSLAIRSVSLEHEGAYLCEADNGVEPSLLKSIRLLVHLQAQFGDADMQLITTLDSAPSSGLHAGAAQSSPGSASGSSMTTLLQLSQAVPVQTSPIGTGGQLTNLIRVGRIVLNSSLAQLQCSPSGDLPLTVDWMKDGQLVYSHTWTHPSTAANNPSSPASSVGLLSNQQQQSPSTLMNLKHQLELGPRYQVVTREKRLASQQQQSHLQNMKQHQAARILPQSMIVSPSVIILETELSIGAVRRQDAGQYSCVARNAYGQAERKLRLLVQEPPEAPELIDIVHISSRSIGLRWLAPYDGNSPITKYTIEFRKQHSEANSYAFGAQLGNAARHKLQTGSAANSGDLHYVTHSDKLMPLKGGLIENALLNHAQSIAPGASLLSQTTFGSGISSGSESGSGSGQTNGPGGKQPASQQNIVQHTIHELEPISRYSLRIVAVNSIGRSRPSVALSVRTDEEVPSIVPTMVETRVLSSRSAKLQWTIAYSPEHELIEGFFVGYRSFSAGSPGNPSPGVIQASEASSPSLSPYNNNINTLDGAQSSGKQHNSQQAKESPAGKSSTFTYKTIRISAESQADPNLSTSSTSSNGGGSQTSSKDGAPNTNSIMETLRSDVELMPIASVTKTLAATSSPNFSQSSNTLTGNNINPTMQQSIHGANVIVVQTFELMLTGLERNTEYTTLIQCFNRKGAGPTSDPIIFKTIANDPPEKLLLVADEISDSSVKLSWRPANPGQQLSYSSRASQQDSSPPIDGFVLAYARFIIPAPNNRKLDNYKANTQQANSMILDNAESQSPLFAANNSTSMSWPDASARISSHFQPETKTDKQQQPSIDQWQAIQLPPQQRSHQLRNLDCGSAYGIKIWAINQVGKGEPSDLIKVTTRGKAPVAPDKRSFLSPNTTQIKLQLSAWYDGGCEIYKFIVKYRSRLINSNQGIIRNNNNNNNNQQQQQVTAKGSTSSTVNGSGEPEWILVSNNIPRDQATLIIRDLQPASHYELHVSAQNQVGLTEVIYRTSTLDTNGQMIAPFSGYPAGANNYGDNDATLIVSGDAADAKWFDDEAASNEHLYDSRRLDNQWGLGTDSNHHHRRGGSFLPYFLQQFVQGPMSFVISIVLILGLLMTFLFYRFNKNGNQFASCSSTSSSSSTTTNECRGHSAGGAGSKLTGGVGAKLGVGVLGCSRLQSSKTNENDFGLANCYDLQQQQMPMLGHAQACSMVDSNESTAGAIGSGIAANNPGLVPDSPRMGPNQHLFGGSPNLTRQLAQGAAATTSDNQDRFIESHYQAALSLDRFNIQNNNNTICTSLNADHYQMHHHQPQQPDSGTYGHHGSIYATLLGNRQPIQVQGSETQTTTKTNDNHDSIHQQHIHHHQDHHLHQQQQNHYGVCEWCII